MSTELTGAVAGEALHFTNDSIRESFAAVPIEGTDSLDVVVRCNAATGADSLTVRIPTVAGDYPIERLRVAPAFGRRPDPATAARIVFAAEFGTIWLSKESAEADPGTAEIIRKNRMYK